MIGNIFRVLISVRSKLFFGFLAMTLIIIMLGGYAFMSIGGAAKVVEDTFDRPLMAVNYARSAGQVFTELELMVLRQNRDADDVEVFSDKIERFKEDLSVARERSISERATSFFDDIDRDFQTWETALGAPSANDAGGNSYQSAALSDISESIANNLEIVIELQTGESFLNREASITQMSRIKGYSFWAVWGALFVTAVLSIWIAVTIINPLKAAATAARKISGGNFDVDIPPGGDDETGVLLKTMSAMQTNIRERMNQQQNLRALAQHRLAESLENSQDAIILTDSESRIIVANAQVGTMFPALYGFDLLQRNFTQYFKEDGQPLNAACELHPDAQELEFEDGRWARVNASRTQEGGRLFIWTDISEAKEQNQHLRDAKEQAEAADKAKTLFLAAMSHELRTPLNAVIGFSDIIKTDSQKANGNDGHARMAGLISQSGAHLLNIVKDVLTIADGGDTNEMTVNMATVDLTEVIEFSLQTMRQEAEAKSVTLIWRRPEKSFSIAGDKNRLQQVILNLLSNAIKFNEVGGRVKVRVLDGPNGTVRVDVIDSGIGIQPEDINRITTPFEQVDNSFTRKHEGVGLGLSIVEQILEPHNGRMQILSEPGKGTCVSLYFPSLNKSQYTGSKMAG